MNRKKSRLFAMATLAAAGTFLALTLPDAAAASRWYTARTVNGRTQPLSAGTETILLPDGRTVGVSAASVSNGLVDLVISLYNNPQGDDNGNTQDVDPANVSQDAYEKIVQYFADGVYEATEGAHSIRNVRIYRNASRQDADVIWQAAGGPSAWYMNQNNIAANINMFDRFSGNNFTNSAAEQEVGGYVLAHEFGHYFYGVLDEYCRWNGGWVNLAANEKTQPCIMNNQWNAAGRIYTWLNHSIMYNPLTLVYANYECRDRTAQYQHYNDGAWVILSRNPTNDPLDTARRQWLRTNRGMRMYYPELAGVAPAGTNPPRIDLSAATPLADLVSRQNLNIIWMGSNIVVEIIIDESGSMDYNDKLASAKAAAKLLVEQVPDNSAVGVIGFDNTVYTISSIIVVTSAVQRATVKTAIDASSGGGWTAIGDAAYEGLSQMQAFGHTNFTRVAFLLSDGQSNDGADPLAAAAAYQTAQIPIMTFGFGSISEIDSRLLTMAGMTGGRYYYSPTSLGAIAAAFQDAFASIAANQNLADGTFLASGTSLEGPSADVAVHIPFQVDSTIADISVTVGYALSNTVSLTLNAPNGTTYQPGSTNDSSSERLLSFSVSSPMTGEWHIHGTASSGSSLRYQVNGGVNEFTYYLTAVSMGGDTVAYPNPIEIVACLTRGASVNDAVVKATITDQDNNTTILTLTNSTGGTYSALFMGSNSLYSIVVSADNSAGTAMYSWADILPSATSSGELGDIPADTAVGEEFTRTASLQVTMTGAYAYAPSAPSSLSASAGAYLDYVKLSWASVWDASLYEIWRSAGDSSAGAVKIAEISRSFTNYMDEAVNVESRYYYWVKAANLAGASEFSSSARGWPLFGPAIRVNDASSITLGVGNRFDVTVLLRTGSYAGLNCDWWVVAYAETTGALYYLNSSFQWTPAAGLSDLRSVYQGPIFDVATPYTVLSYNALPAGIYKFYFGLDTNVNGYLDVDAVYYDMAVLNVE